MANKFGTEWARSHAFLAEKCVGMALEYAKETTILQAWGGDLPVGSNALDSL